MPFVLNDTSSPMAWFFKIAYCGDHNRIDNCRRDTVLLKFNNLRKEFL